MQSSTKCSTKTYLSLFLVACSFMLLQQSCKKTDSAFNDHADATTRFFNLPGNAKSPVQRVAAALQKQNSTKEFIKAFANNEGFPVWDKSCINLVTPNSATTATGTFNLAAATGDATPDTIVITPLVLDKADYVNGFILSKVSDTVSMTLYRNSDYQYLPFQTATSTTYTTAEDFAIHMMAMDHNVFGYTSFAIKDKRLFNNSSNYKDTAGVKRTIDFGNNNVGTTINYAQLICVTITTTTTSNHCPYPPNQCPDIHTGVLGPCDNCQEYCANISTTYSTQCLSTGGGTGWPSFPPPPPPTGGGGSGGGGTGLPPCPGGGIPMTNSAIPVNCNPVPNPWPSIPPPPPNPTPNTDSIVKALLKKDNVDLKHFRDSIFDVAYTNDEEWHFFIKNVNGVTKHLGERTDNDPDYVSSNKSVRENGNPDGDWHCHQDSLPGERHIHDPVDICESNGWFRKKLYYRSYVDCGDTLYVVVNENLTLVKHYFQSRVIRNLIYEDPWKQLAGAGTNRRALGIQFLKDLLGSSSINGLGLYKSVNADKTEFVKLN